MFLLQTVHHPRKNLQSSVLKSNSSAYCIQCSPLNSNSVNSEILLIQTDDDGPLYLHWIIHYYYLWFSLHNKNIATSSLTFIFLLLLQVFHAHSYIIWWVDRCTMTLSSWLDILNFKRAVKTAFYWPAVITFTIKTVKFIISTNLVDLWQFELSESHLSSQHWMIRSQHISDNYKLTDIRVLLHTKVMYITTHNIW